MSKIAPPDRSRPGFQIHLERRFARCQPQALDLFLQGCLLIFHALECLRASPTHVHRCFAGVSIEYLQTPAKALDRDSIGEDVQLKLYLSSELFGKLLCQPIRVPLEVDRNDLADSQHS